MGNVQCRARFNSASGDVQCGIWTNLDPDGRHPGDHEYAGVRWTNFNLPPGAVESPTRCDARKESGLGRNPIRCEIDSQRTDRRHVGDHVSGNTWWVNADRLNRMSGEPFGLTSVTLEPVAQDSQVGGDHYRKFKIQPWDIWAEYGLDAFTATVVKYLLRAGHKGSKLEDLRKARHTLDRLIEIEEAKEG